MVIRHKAYKRFAVLFSVLVSAFASACASHEMLYHNNEHSEGIADAGNKMLLINILQAAKRYPAYYSTITDYVGKQRFSAETSLKTPFGPDLINQIYEATTKLAGNNGVNTVKLNNIAQGKGVKVLHNQLDRTEYRRLLILGWPPELVGMVLVQQVGIHREFLAALISHAKTTCGYDGKTGHRFKDRACATKAAIEKRCGRIPPKPNFHNRADDECEFLQFQALNALTFIADGGLNLRLGKDDKVVGAIFPPGKVKEKFEYLKKSLKKQNRAPYEFYLRSPAMIITYIGEIVAAQLFLEKPFVPTIDVYEPDGTIRSMAVFLLKRGVQDTPAKFSVTYEGETYAIPKREYGRRASHASYEILSYIRTLIDHATAESEFGKSSTILVQ